MWWGEVAHRGDFGGAVIADKLEAVVCACVRVCVAKDGSDSRVTGILGGNVEEGRSEVVEHTYLGRS